MPKPKLYPEVLGRRYEMPATFERQAVDKDNRTVDLSIASDSAIDHWFGRIILDHSGNSIRMDRIRAGAPLLLNHDANQQIGVLENVRVENGKLRTTARFSRSTLATEIFQDVEDGIRRNTSVGFILHELDLEKKDDDGPNTYRSRDWEPVEGSIASVPRDISVGVGRSLDTRQAVAVAVEVTDDDDDEDEDAEPGDDTGAPPAGASGRGLKVKPKAKAIETRSVMPEKIAATVTPNPFDVMTMRTDQFVNFAISFAGNFEERKVELEELAREFALTNKSETELFTAINEKRGAWAKNLTPHAMPLVSLTEKERQRYSISKAIMADANARDRDYRGGETNCFELEISRDIERKLNAPGTKQHGGFYMPTHIALRRGMELQRAGLDSKTPTKGQELVFTEPGSFIDLLRNKAMVIQLGAQVLPGLQGNVAFPRQTGAGAFSWVAENPGADVAESNATLDQVLLSPKTGQSTTSYSRQLLTQGVTDVDSMVQNDLILVNALAVDLAALHGTGGVQPTGLYALAGVNAVAMGGAITFAKVVDMETAIASQNADVGVMAYLTTPEIRGKAKQAPLLGNTIALPLWSDGEMNGYRAEATNQISKVLGAGTNEHGIIFGVWSELLIGEWGALEIITDPYRLKKQGMIEVTTFIMIDINARYAKAFSKGTGLLPV